MRRVTASNIGKKLEYLMNEEGYSAQELADAAGLKRDAIYKAMAPGKRVNSISTIALGNLCLNLDINCNWFFDNGEPLHRTSPTMLTPSTMGLWVRASYLAAKILKANGQYEEQHEFDQNSDRWRLAKALFDQLVAKAEQGEFPDDIEIAATYESTGA